MNPEQLRIDEMRTSQVPALQMLIKLGYEYIPPDKALELRGGRASEVILEPILTEQLRKMNRIEFKGKEYPRWAKACRSRSTATRNISACIISIGKTHRKMSITAPPNTKSRRQE